MAPIWVALRSTLDIQLMFLPAWLTIAFLLRLRFWKILRSHRRMMADAEAAIDDEVTSEEIRSELMRDPAALKLMVADSTPEDVQRYLFLEAYRRARYRKMKLLDDSENDLFAKPRRLRPDYFFGPEHR